MRYELLIVAEGPARGRIVHAQPAPAVWGAKEGPPRFRLAAVDVPAGVDPLSCTWDGYAERLVVPAPYNTIDTCHLLYHVYPLRANDVWRRNLAQLRQRLHAFNGRRLVAVAQDGATASLREVRDELPGCELIPLDNDPRIGSDAQGLARLLPMVRSIAPNEAIFFAHAKGVSRQTDPARSQGIEYWRNALYHCLLDDLPAVRAALLQRPCVGACKMVHGPDHRWPTGLRWGTWHYAGTFWWVRSDALFSDPRWPFVAADRFGAESYLGGLFAPDQAASLYQPVAETSDGALHYRPETHTLRIPDDDGLGRRISVVITCKGRLAHLKMALPLWRWQEVPPGEVIVVDYGCPEKTADYLAQHSPWIRCIRVTRDVERFNISRARNIGITAATGDRIIMADADFLVPLDFVARVEEQFERGANLIQATITAKHPEKEEPFHYVSGQAAFTRDLWRRLHGFDEAMQDWGYDDIDFYERAKRVGATVRAVTSCSFVPHGDAERVAFCLEKDKNRSSARNLARMNDHARPINPDGYGRM